MLPSCVEHRKAFFKSFNNLSLSMKVSRLLLSPLLFFQEDCEALVGGQAVLEGVVMRHKDCMAIAVRMPNKHEDGTISVRTQAWFSLTKNPILQKPFLRGFPAFLETLINGIRALNYSASIHAEEQGEAFTPFQLFLCLIASLIFAVLLFVVVPHGLSFFMNYMGMSTDVEGLSFHLWDGFFKTLIFILYIVLISFVPDIREVFRYHGAEHKVIHAYEKYRTINLENAMRCSRLHPRCGTTFLLFVLVIAIIMHTLLVPLFVQFLSPDTVLKKHALTIAFKLLLMIPIAAFAYEAIRLAARIQNPILGGLLRAPGLALQRLTTWEPKRKHLEVALVSLKSALKCSWE